MKDLQNTQEVRLHYTSTTDNLAQVASSLAPIEETVKLITPKPKLACEHAYRWACTDISTKIVLDLED